MSSTPLPSRGHKISPRSSQSHKEPPRPPISDDDRCTDQSRQRKQKARVSSNNSSWFREIEDRREEERSGWISSAQTCVASAEILGRSNLDCFLTHTTPAAQRQNPSKTTTTDGASGRWTFYSERADRMPYFNLGDLWASFDEWSAYGAGVPLSLPSGETVVQYYVPYLSALQIYLRSGCSLFSKTRRLGDDSDLSDTGDVKDNSSDSSCGNENEKAYRLAAIMKQSGADGYSTGEACDTASCVSSETISSSEEGASEGRDRHGDLVLEYFERSSPYGRAPLAGKISELAAGFPQLLSLHSNDLSSASWFSVAWYPIYRIPTGPTMRDLATCFLTFHSLWTPLMPDDAILGGISSHSEGIKETEEHTIRNPSSWRIDSEKVELPAFGLASYKLRGPFWASAAPEDKTRASSLASSADSWLKHLRVQHPDFDFFASRGTFGRH